MKNRLLPAAIALPALIVIIACAAGVFWMVRHHNTPQVPAAATPVAAPKTPVQWLEETVNCAALLATHQAAMHGEMDSKTSNIISYALGKAQEYAMQAGLDKARAKAMYDEKTLAYFMAYSNNSKDTIKRNRQEADNCHTLLLQYEPNAQIQSSINKAKAQINPSPVETAK